MNPNKHPFLYVAGPESKDTGSNAEPKKSPYLKAILSGKAAGSAVVKKLISAVSSDKAAAIRYIKESAFLRKA